MQPHVFRLVAFVGLSVVFGVAVWVVEAGNSNTRALLAALPAAEPSKTKDKCVAECTRANGEKFQCGKGVTVNKKGEQESSTPAPDVKAGTCRTTYTDQDGKQHTINENSNGYLVDENGKPIQFASKEGQQLQLTASDLLNSQGETSFDVNNLTDTQKANLVRQALSATQGNSLTGAAALIPPDFTPEITNPTPDTGGASAPAPAAAPSASSPPKQIGNIANSGSGYTPSGSSNVSNSTFSPSPQLGSSPFNLGSLFGGGGGGAGSPSGGTIAYAPQGDPGYYNRNFESVDAQITFPKAQPSPGDILAYREV